MVSFCRYRSGGRCARQSWAILLFWGWTCLCWGVWYLRWCFCRGSHYHLPFIEGLIAVAWFMMSPIQLVLNIRALTKNSGSLIHIIISLLRKIFLLLYFVNIRFFKSELPPNKFPISKIIDNEANSISTPIHQLALLKILWQMDFELLNVFY